jgi:hypothetical protein
MAAVFLDSLGDSGWLPRDNSCRFTSAKGVQWLAANRKVTGCTTMENVGTFEEASTVKCRVLRLKPPKSRRSSSCEALRDAETSTLTRRLSNKTAMLGRWCNPLTT